VTVANGHTGRWRLVVTKTWTAHVIDDTGATVASKTVDGGAARSPWYPPPAWDQEILEAMMDTIVEQTTPGGTS
jgi:hypothetical protein